MRAYALAENLAATGHSGIELPVPPIWIGIGAFAFLLVLLAVVLGFGKGRPHA
jgi:hypothetical protein